MDIQEEGNHTTREDLNGSYIPNITRAQSENGLRNHIESTERSKSRNRSRSGNRSKCTTTGTKESERDNEDTVIINCKNKRLIIHHTLTPTIVILNSTNLEKMDEDTSEYRRKQPSNMDSPFINRSKEQNNCRKQEKSRINTERSRYKEKPIAKNVFVASNNGETPVNEDIEEIDNTGICEKSTERSRGRSWDQSRGRSRGRSRGKSRGRSRGRSRGNSHGRSRSRSRGRSRDRSRGKSRGRSRGRSHGHSRGRSRGHSRGRSRGHSRGRSRGRSRGKSRGHSRGRSRGHSRGHSRGRSRGRSRGNSRGRSRGHSRERSTGHSGGNTGITG